MKCIFLFIACLSSCSLIEDYRDDNIVEEIAESILEKETGIDVDFTPKSPENLYQKMINGKM